MTELKIDSNLDWLEERTIILSPTGSHAYGTNTENSDKDFKGVVIPPVDYYLGLETFNEYNNSGGKNFRNTQDDVDISLIHVNKFVRDAMQGVPNNIEILFLRPEDYLKVTDLGQLLIDNRHLFLSKQIKTKFGGYAYSQIQKLKNKQSNGTGRQDLIQAHGYDTKFFMHSIRLLSSAIEILETGDYHTHRPDRAFLIKCRNGEYTLEEALQLVEQYDARLKASFDKSPLPKTPDYQKINQLLIDINRQALAI